MANPTTGTTGTGLDTIIDLIWADTDLAENISQDDIIGGTQAADGMNQILIEAITAGNLFDDGLISIGDVRAINGYIRSHHKEAWKELHGDDEYREETGYHLVQNDGGSTTLEYEQLINTVFDGVYHLGFRIKAGHLLNEDGDENASLEDVSHWLTYYMTGGDSYYLGTKGNDEVYGHILDDTLLLGAGRDYGSGEGGDDVLRGGAGRDTLSGDDGHDQLFGETGRDKLYGGNGHDQLFGGAGRDILDGDDGNDVLNGGAGRDELNGGSGDDILSGEAGRDKLWAGMGDDQLSGGAGNDELGGDDGDDVLNGDAGNDELWGENGNDSIFGGDGNDQIAGGNGRDEIDGGAGRDEIDGGRGDDTILGGDGRDDMWGGNGNDRLDGGTGRDQIGGGKGDDTLLGGDGNDVLGGGEGDDALNGGDGNDVLYGDEGADSFLFARSANGDDKIEGFNHDEGDRIVVASGVDVALSALDGGSHTLLVFTDSDTGAALGSAKALWSEVQASDIVVDDLAFV